MRLVLQVVNKANVTIKDNIFSSINKGLLIFVGFNKNDNKETIDKVVNKIKDLRIFSDKNGLTNLSLNDINGEILSVSQFTLYANIKKGRRPSFTEALNGVESIKLYDYFNNSLKKYFVIKTGVFGEDMKINLENDGPFTLHIDSNIDI